MSLDFLKGVTKDLEKAGIQVGASEPPRYWYSTGNYVLNKIISGSFLKGIPQGRITCFTGPSASGKSFLLCNAMREAQKKGAHLVVIDSENALDDDFVSAIGVNPNEDYTYVPVDTMSQCKKTVSSVVQGYKKEYGYDNDEAPQLVISIDSLDMLLTDTEMENVEKGVTKGDQGQRNKQLKSMLRGFVQSIKRFDIAIIVTAQVYRNQDVMNGEGLWIVSDAIRYSLSQVCLLSKLKLKDKTTKKTEGIRMKCEGFKTRFAKPYQNVTIEVPYESGMDHYNGLLEVAIGMDIIQQKGAWCYFGEHKWNGKRLPAEYCNDVLIKCEAERSQYLDAMVDDSDIDVSDNPTSKSKRKSKITGDT